MISFIKKLFGFGSKEVTPSAAPYKIEPATTLTAPAKKNRRPRNRNKEKAGSAATTQKAPAAKVAKVKSTKSAPAKKSK
jgi:hypothetical protein